MEYPFCMFEFVHTHFQYLHFHRWRILILPALFPYMVTGLMTAGGGAWNASIIAEHVEYQGKIFSTNGIGSIIATATANADYPMLLAATLTLIVTVVSINRLIWAPLFRLASTRFVVE